MKIKVFNVLLLIIITVILCINSACKEIKIIDENPELISQPLFILIKADDFDQATERWDKFIELARDEDIPINIGVISKDINHKTILKMREYALLRQKRNAKPLIEFWNHGYDHSKNGDIKEFSGTPLQQQYEHIRKVQLFFSDSIGLICHSFGAPYNALSNETFLVLREFSEIKVIFGLSLRKNSNNSEWLDLKNENTSIENRRLYLSIDYDSANSFPSDSATKIINSYTQYSQNPYVIIQVHPRIWKDEDLNNFKQLIRFLKQKNTEFMTSYSYWESICDSQSELFLTE